GDVAWVGVGSTHGYFNTGTGRVRWVETQAPQPPAQHSYRWPGQWEYLKSRLASGRTDPTR
ncbi:MAG TPA: cupin domain-containing protein, partial [Chloroflexota bacterium]|nr:cupin domain-containing protein [Chloroflexota bacterium]